jgi:hypothetical protein
MKNFGPKDPRTWIAELKAAGWKQIHMTLWQHPDGRYYRGPYNAWEIMKAERDAPRWFSYN